MIVESEAEEEQILRSKSNSHLTNDKSAVPPSPNSVIDSFAPKNYVKVIVNFGPNNHDNIIKAAKMKIEAKQRQDKMEARYLPKKENEEEDDIPKIKKIKRAKMAAMGADPVENKRMLALLMAQEFHNVASDKPDVTQMCDRVVAGISSKRGVKHGIDRIVDNQI